MRNIFFTFALIFSHSCIANDPFYTQRMYNTMEVNSWKDIRDEGIEKQNFDYSCGSAAVATILRSYYGIVIHEKDILREVGKIEKDRSTSFFDLKIAVQKFGFQATGISTGINSLKMIKLPVILYLKDQNQDHFSVLRGISDSHVRLADPSRGNINLTINQFRKLWENNNLKGNILIISPDLPVTRNISFFHKPTINNLSVRLLLSSF